LNKERESKRQTDFKDSDRENETRVRERKRETRRGREELLKDWLIDVAPIVKKLKN